MDIHALLPIGGRALIFFGLAVKGATFTFRFHYWIFVAGR
jgi:hypothetical protein